MSNSDLFKPHLIDYYNAFSLRCNISTFPVKGLYQTE